MPAAAPAKVEIFVDGKPVSVEPGITLIQACDLAGVEIPRFCYHDRLAVAGNCRMCLIELEKSPKPVASCAMPVVAGMKVWTNTPMVKKAREGVMEFLLANHPLDCPICDQGGECDLQDQAVGYGSDRGRFAEFVGKRAVEDKNFGPLVKTSMNRCIHCTRCVRFANEVAGVEELGTSGRGNDMQIGTYIEKMLDSELSGNIIDLCPVGALTSKPYEFRARPWELTGVESVDVLDAMGSSVRVDIRGHEVMRILPRLNEEINEEWATDKARFSYDGLRTQRLTTPLLRSKDGKFIPCTWEQAFERIRQEVARVEPQQMQAVVGQLTDAESMIALKDLFTRMGSNQLRFEGESRRPSFALDQRSSYLFNSTIRGVDEADVILLVGTNPKLEAPLLNARIRRAWTERNIKIGLIGAPAKLTYEYTHLGETVAALKTVLDGKSAAFKSLRDAKRPMVIVGQHVASRDDASAIFAALGDLIEKASLIRDGGAWNGYNMLHHQAARVAAYDLGFVPPGEGLRRDPKIVYLLGADELSSDAIPSDAFVIYQGHTGDVGAERAHVVLPGATYTEKNGTYVNTEGRAQLTAAAVKPPGWARDDWKIVRALSEYLGHALPYSTLSSVRERLAQISPALVRYGVVEPATSVAPRLGVTGPAASLKLTASSGVLSSPIVDYYRTNSISRASGTMAKCSATFVLPKLSPETRGAASVSS